MVPGRISIAHWLALVPGGVDVASVYLITGEGPSDANAQLLEALADELLRLNRPFVVGGDWQMSVDEFDSMHWVQRLDGVVVAHLRRLRSRLRRKRLCCDRIQVRRRRSTPCCATV